MRETATDGRKQRHNWFLTCVPWLPWQSGGTRIKLAFFCSQARTRAKHLQAFPSSDKQVAQMQKRLPQAVRVSAANTRPNFTRAYPRQEREGKGRTSLLCAVRGVYSGSEGGGTYTSCGWAACVGSLCSTSRCVCAPDAAPRSAVAPGCGTRCTATHLMSSGGRAAGSAPYGLVRWMPPRACSARQGGPVRARARSRRDAVCRPAARCRRAAASNASQRQTAHADAPAEGARAASCPQHTGPGALTGRR